MNEKTETHNEDRSARTQYDAQEVIDVEALWLDLSVSPADLIRLDPLGATMNIVEEAECPELADFILQRLPTRRFSEAAEARWREARKKRLKVPQESPRAFIARLRRAGVPVGPQASSGSPILIDKPADDYVPATGMAGSV